MDIHQDLRFERLEWRVQHAGWVMVSLILLAALVGLLGPGWLSHETAGSPGSKAWIDYSRYERHASPAMLLIHMDQLNSKRPRVVFDEAYVSAFRIDTIDPEPSLSYTAGQRRIYEFASEGESAQVTFHVEPQGFGRATGVVDVNGERLRVDQFIYP